MIRLSAVVLAPAVVWAVVAAAPAPQGAAPETFLVEQRGLAFLRADGEEQERLDPYATCGALSPDGRWLAAAQPGVKGARGDLIIRPRGGAGEAATVPLVWGHTGSGCLPVWSADSKQVLIGENGRGKDGAEETVYRVYDRVAKRLTDLKVPEGHWITGWSPDGKRLLTTFRTVDHTVRIAWVNFDGTGQPEFLTAENDVAFGARLSPDGRRILCLAGPKPPKGEWGQVRLYMIDLATKKRTAVDEPGHTHGFCWSPDGSRVAYTWQRPLEKPAEVAERETLLITCEPDGSNRTTVTRRTYRVPQNSSGRGGVIIFFQVLAWR